VDVGHSFEGYGYFKSNGSHYLIGGLIGSFSKDLL
jgi:hypothetical protein